MNQSLQSFTNSNSRPTQNKFDSYRPNNGKSSNKFDSYRPNDEHQSITHQQFVNYCLKNGYRNIRQKPNNFKKINTTTYQAPKQKRASNSHLDHDVRFCALSHNVQHKNKREILHNIKVNVKVYNPLEDEELQTILNKNNSALAERHNKNLQALEVTTDQLQNDIDKYKEDKCNIIKGNKIDKILQAGKQSMVEMSALEEECLELVSKKNIVIESKKGDLQTAYEKDVQNTNKINDMITGLFTQKKS